MTGPTLHEALAELGITSQKLPRDEGCGTRTLLDREGNDIGSFTAKTGWELVEQKGQQIESKP